MAKKGGGQIIPPFIIGDKDNLWGGLNTANKDNRTLDRGESFDELNWITGRDQDHVELRRGSALLGTTRRNVAHKHVTGLGVGIVNDGSEVPFFTYGRKLLFYNSETNDTEETNLFDILPVAADGENVSFAPYENLAGSFMYLTSPNSSIYKVSTANPDSVSDQETKDYHFGFCKINRSRFFGMNRQGESQSSRDITGLYLSHVDKQLVTDYTDNYMSLPNAILEYHQETGGTVPDDTYYFVLTAIGPAGVETTQGPETSFTVTGGGGNARIRFLFLNVAGATQYRLYGSLISGDYSDPSSMVASIMPSTNFVNGIIVPQEGINELIIQEYFPAAGSPPSSTTQQLITTLDIGDGTENHYSGTFSFFRTKTIFYVVITDGDETFIDDRSGHLVGNHGGTGTINYVTGQWSVDFGINVPNGYPITAAYYLENSTDDGILDFNIDLNDLTNASAQIFRQDDGAGKAQAVFPYQGVEYCFHVLRSYSLAIGQGTTIDGDPKTTFENQPYYEQIGIPSERAAFPTGDGILFLNNSNPANPEASFLQIPPGSTNLTVVPVSVSEDLDLSIFGFDECVVWRWGDFDIVSCQDRVNGLLQSFNGVTFIRNTISGVWNRLDYYISCLGEYTGTLLSGDAISANVYTLFSGFDDDGAVIDNFRKSAYTDLGIQGLKTVGYISLQGLIQTSQKLEVYISLDNGGYALAYTILGNGPYVSQNVVAVGTETVGTRVVGGGNGNQQIFANEYELDIPIHTDRFEYISFMIRAIDVGYVSVNRAEYKDPRFKRRRVLSYEDLEINA